MLKWITIPLLIALAIGIFIGVGLHAWLAKPKVITEKVRVEIPAPARPEITRTTADDEKCAPRKYKVVSGDTLSELAAKEYGGRVYLYTLLAEYNGIENPDLIYVGQVIELPYCLTSLPDVATRKTQLGVKTVAKQAEKEKRQEEQKTKGETKNEEKKTSNLFVTPLLDSEPPTLAGLPPNLPALLSAAQVETLDFTPQPDESVVTERVKASSNEVLLQSGTYKLPLTREDMPALREGVFPALVVSRDGTTESPPQNLWRKREKSTVTIVQDGSKFDAIFTLKSPLGYESAIAFDIAHEKGPSHITQINADLIVENAKPEDGEFKPPKNLPGKKYNALQAAYPIKRSKFRSVFGAIGKYGTGGALGFAVGGPVGAAINGPLPFVLDLMERR